MFTSLPYYNIIHLMGTEFKKKHLADINFIKLPLFSASKSKDIPTSYEFEYMNRTEKINVQIENGRLSLFHRKLFLILEFLYLQKNPNFDKYWIRTTFKELQETLGVKGNWNKKLIDSIEDLQKVNIRSQITQKTEDGRLEIDEGMRFNLLPKVQWKTTKQLQKRTKEDLRKYTSHIDIHFQDFHVENLKNKYYRILNFELIRELSSKSIRMFDYLTLNAYYRENGVWRQKRKLTISYDHLMDYLLLKKRTSPSHKEQQIISPLEELRDKEVIRTYKFSHSREDGTFIILYLSPNINMWEKYTSVTDHELETIEKLTPLEMKMKTRGLSLIQINRIMSNYEREYIEDKIKQLDYLLRYNSLKVKGQGSYLYNSLFSDWIEPDYIEWKAQEKQLKLNYYSKVEQVKYDQLQEQYEEYCTRICDQYWQAIEDVEKQEIEMKVNAKVGENKVVKMKKSIEELYRQATLQKVLRQYAPLPTFYEWKENIRE